MSAEAIEPAKDGISLADMFRLTMLPAGDGDCLLVSWTAEGKVRHALVDGGRFSTYDALRPRLEQISADGETLELLVLTHVDADHIEGGLRYVQDPLPPIAPDRVWYNAFEALGGMNPRSIAQGDRYAAAITKLGWPLNGGFESNQVSVESAAGKIALPGMTITVLGPDARGVEAMRGRWADWRSDQAPRRATPAPFSRSPMPHPIDVEALCAPSKIDTEVPNGSSIALLLEHGDRRLLLAGDAHPDTLVRSLGPLAAAEGGKLRVDLFKIAHHGSRGNVTRELLELLDCRRFAISTDGSRHGHPDPEAIARLLVFGPGEAIELHFNYASDRTMPWNDPKLKEDWRYVCNFGEPDGMLSIEV